MEKIIGKRLVYLASVDSTSDEAKRLVAKGAREGLVVIAKEQSRGRGKPGRGWDSPADLGIYLSAIVKPYRNPPDLVPLTLLSAQAVVSSIFKTCQITATIKQPNDVLMNGKKVCGILVERVKTGELIIGIGVNVNNPTGSFPKEIADSASSLWIEAGKQIDGGAFTKILLDQLNCQYLAYLSGI